MGFETASKRGAIASASQSPRAASAACSIRLDLFQNSLGGPGEFDQACAQGGWEPRRSARSRASARFRGPGSGESLQTDLPQF